MDFSWLVVFGRGEIVHGQPFLPCSDLVSGPGEVLTSYVTDLVSGFRGKYMDIRRNLWISALI